MKKFIYVFNKEDKDKMLKRGFTLLKNDERNSMYVFALTVSDGFSFELLDGVEKYTFSNTLTF